MSDSSRTPRTNEGCPIQNKRARCSRGATMMVKFTKICNIDIKMPVDFNLKSERCYSEHDMTFKSYVVLFGRRKAGIL